MLDAKTHSIRAARTTDVAEIQRLINHFAAQGEMLPRTLHELYENLRDFDVCELNDQVIGCAALHIVWNDLAEVKSLAVSEIAQGRGVGAQLTLTALDEARALGLSRVFALTYKPAFFERLGFHRIDKNDLPQKIWGECIRCPKFPDCNEQAVIIHL